MRQNITSPSYLAIDPGEHNRSTGSTGWAISDDKGNVLAYGQLTRDELLPWLRTNLSVWQYSLKTVIVEDYKNHGHKGFGQKKWSRNITSKHIGQIEAICFMHNIPIVLQPNTVKSIGYKWAGLKQAPSNHDISHQFDAVAHLVYYTQQKGIRPVGKALMKNADE